MNFDKTHFNSYHYFTKTRTEKILDLFSYPIRGILGGCSITIRNPVNNRENLEGKCFSTAAKIMAVVLCLVFWKVGLFSCSSLLIKWYFFPFSSLPRGNQYDTTEDMIKAGDLEKVKEVLRFQHIDFQDNKKVSLLFWASLYAQKEIVKYLISKGANISSKFYNEDVKGATVLMCASALGNLEIVQMLEDKKSTLNWQDKEGKTALNHAVNLCHQVIVQFLIDRGADVNKVDDNGNTPLHIASFNGHLALVQLLIDRGGDVNIVSNQGDSPIHLASFNGHLTVVQFLKKCGVDVNIVNNQGNSPIHLASFNGHLPVVQFLIKCGVDVNKLNDIGTSPLHLASSAGHLNVVKFLIEHGANLDEINNKGYSPLHFAAKSGNKEIVELLLEKGSQINLSHKGFPPHYFAEINGFFTLSQNLFLHSSPIIQNALPHRFMSHRFGVKLKKENICFNGFQNFKSFESLLDSLKKNQSWVNETPSSWTDEETRALYESISLAVNLSYYWKSKEEKTKLLKDHEGKLIIFPIIIEKHSQMFATLDEILILGDRALTLKRGEMITPKPNLQIMNMNTPQNLGNAFEKLLQTTDEASSYYYKEFRTELNLRQIGEIRKNPSHSNTCTWNTAKTALESAFVLLLYKKFLKENPKNALAQAKAYGKKMYRAWVLEDLKNFTREYIDTVPQEDPFKLYIIGYTHLHACEKVKKGKEIHYQQILTMIEKKYPDISKISSQLVVSITQKGERFCEAPRDL